MTLGDMVLMAARYTDRADEMVKTTQADGTAAYTGHALSCFRLFRDAINEAYAEAASVCLAPERSETFPVPDNRVLDIGELIPDAAAVRAVFSADGQREIGFRFLSRFEIIVDALPGEAVQVRALVLPPPLENEEDEPVFPESAVEPMVYVSLAAARMWQSERQHAASQAWLGDYYRLLRRVRSGAGDRRKCVLPVRPFR